MNILDLIAKIGADYIEKKAGVSVEEGSTSRFLLDSLQGDQVAALCNEILSRPSLKSICEIKVPRTLVADFGLPDDCITDEKTTFWRNAQCDKPILVLANTDDEQGQSLKDIIAISTTELLAEPELWVKRAAENTGLSEEHRQWWTKAIKALQVVRPQPITVFAGYALQIRQVILAQGLPLIHALGWALPALQSPRDSAVFTAISEKQRSTVDKWKKIYSYIFNECAPYLRKTTPKRQVIEQELLDQGWDKIRSDVNDAHTAIFESFIAAPPKWNDEARALSELEWNTDKVSALFKGLKVTQRRKIGKETVDFYEDYPISLSDDEQDLLRRLDERKAREANEDEIAFYEGHRTQLLDNQRLKARWDRYVFGTPIECDDFFIGLIRGVGRLFEQAEVMADKKSLRIEAIKRNERHWVRDHSVDSMLYFVHRYRGLHDILGKKVQWDLNGLFDYEKIYQREKDRQKKSLRRNTSTSKAANQIKFTVILINGEGADAEEASVQVIWSFNPNSICCGFADDWEKAIKNPYCHNEVICETVSAKGQLQFIDLTNVGTMMPLGSQSRGCLVKTCKKDSSIEKEWFEELQKSLSQGFLKTEGYEALKNSWELFSTSYKEALQEFWDIGLESLSVMKVEETYVALLKTLHKYAIGDKNRVGLWGKILEIGTVRVEGPSPAVIIPPWHPIRLLSMAVKAYQVAGLIRYLLETPVVNFGDRRLFFEDLCYEFAAPYYPEVALGMHGTEPITLTQSDNYADYTLMEPATKGTEPTSENPKEITKGIRSIVQRYTELQPHEKANLSMVLYNSDSARLPEETVNSLSDMYEDEEEVRCQIVLRHRDKAKLASLYQTLIENSDDRQDSLVTSETYRDFMARLRIGILADDDKLQDVDGPPTDLVFLHNVISKLAKQNWQAETSAAVVSNLFEHYPPRLSRRRPASKDEMKSIVYMACPIQPEFGWLYFKTLRCIMDAVDPAPNVEYLPTLEINFQNNETREIFDEVHKLGQWVVNYDSLLERRQLRNQGVQIIRFQHAKYAGHNIVISSKAPLSLLDLMIVRRLKDLLAGISISDTQLGDLSMRMREEANEISGDIVLRAAKRGRFVNELIGLVLSRSIIESEIGKDNPIAWFLLDDYAQWLGQKEEHLADIMALSPSYVDGKPVLTIMISESKYVTSTSLAQQSHNSARQLYETVARIEDALFGVKGRLDRELWLSRIADMLIDGIEVTPGSDIKLPDWRNMIRNGEVKILLKGYSHVFVHTQQPGEGDPGSRSNVKNKMFCWQEVFGKERVQQLVFAYMQNESPINVRKGIGGTEPWLEGSPKLPAESAKWANYATKVNEEVETASLKAAEFIDTDKRRPEIPVKDDRTESPVANILSTSEKVTSEDNALSSQYSWAKESLRVTIEKLSLQVKPLEDDGDWLELTVSSLRNALIGYGMQANLIDKRLTPNAALAFFKGSDLLTAAGVTAVRSKLLTVHSLDVKNVIPVPGKLIVTVARPERQTISLLQLWKNRALTGSPGQANLKLIVGSKEFNGETLYLEPAVKDAPHTLIAGTTGSGKSVLVQNLILDIACTNTPKQAQIYLIDPKLGLDYSVFQNLPHLVNGVVTNQAIAKNLLQGIVEEMRRRMSLMAGKAANVIEYNRLASEVDQIPIIWVIHDEFAAWMIDDEYKDHVSNIVQQLGMMARAAGIFLIFAAQRPEARVMTAQLRSNLDNRLILRVSSEADSEMALGEKGAEQLLGKGHLVARLPEESGLTFAQVPLLTRQQTEEIVKAINALYA
jgi:S-DNA-T family DNA segregation ATPase FtsK/SpoIIIE